MCGPITRFSVKSTFRPNLKKILRLIYNYLKKLIVLTKSTINDNMNYKKSLSKSLPCVKGGGLRSNSEGL